MPGGAAQGPTAGATRRARLRRLRAQADFARVRAEGRAWSHPLVVLVAAPGAAPDGATRVGVTASRRVGGAVVRNRARRRIGAALRQYEARLAPRWDLVLVARPAVATAPFDALSGAVAALLNRAGLLRAEDACAASPSA